MEYPVHSTGETGYFSGKIMYNLTAGELVAVKWDNLFHKSVYCLFICGIFPKESSGRIAFRAVYLFSEQKSRKKYRQEKIKPHIRHGKRQ